MPKYNFIKQKKLITNIVFSFLIVILLVVLALKLPNINQTENLLLKSNKILDLYVGLFVLLTYIASAGTFYILAINKIPLLKTLLIQFASTTLNRLFPLGIGSAGTNFIYLNKLNHTKWQTATVIAVSNISGEIADIGLIVLALIFYPLKLQKLSYPSWIFYILIATILVGITIATLLLTRSKRKLTNSYKKFITELKYYNKQPNKLIIGFLFSLCLSIANVAALYFSILALGLNLNIVAVILSFSLAQFLGSLVPIPGGGGVLDISLVGALVAYHMQLDQAIAAVFLFRLEIFWLPLIIGIPALIISKNKRYI